MPNIGSNAYNVWAITLVDSRNEVVEGDERNAWIDALYPDFTAYDVWLPLGDALDNTSLSWSTGSTGYGGDWFGQNVVYYYGGDSAQSGPITHNQNSWIQTTVTGPGTGTLSFYWAVSSESNYDWLRFYIDNTEQTKISGYVNWQQKTYSIGEGTHVLKWVYSKNWTGSSGSDAGYLDRVVWTPTSALPAVTIAATDSLATEAGPTTGMFTVTRTGSTSSALTVYYSASGTATSGSDYIALSGSVTIPAGSASAAITVQPIDDVAEENDETVIVALSTNAAYTVSSPSSATITIVSDDVDLPTGSIIINSGATFTNTTSVTLNLSATDPSGVSQMCISNTNSCSSWITYATSKSWTLPGGDGIKTVYVLFKDGVGNANANPFSDSIILDTTAPTDDTISATAGDKQVSLVWSGFSDATSGIANYKLVFGTGGTPSSCSSGTQIYSGTATSYNHTGLTNGTTYYYRVCAIDNAQNTSSGATTSAKPSGEPAGIIELPQTGQKNCYDSYGNNCTCGSLNCPSGQDGEIKAGVPWPDPRFVVGTGAEAACILDELTGLMWSKNGNMTNGPVTWQDALNFVASINGGAGLCGHNDWRLPNINEMESLINAGVADSAVWLNSKGFSSIQAHNYWSSTTRANFSDIAWIASLQYGYTYSDDKTNNISYALPVRNGGVGIVSLPRTGQTVSSAPGDDGEIQSGVAWPNQCFTDNGDGTVRDNLTRLIWLKDANCIKTQYPSFDNYGVSMDGMVSWEYALNFVEGINGGSFSNCSAGYHDWRLPNKKELYSLLDFSQYEPAIACSQYFINVNDFYWSSTTVADNRGFSWGLYAPWGSIGNTDKSNDFYVWPVRGGCSIKFIDIPLDFWAENYIKALYCKGITTGYPDGTYRPALNVSRGQMAAFIIRAKYGEDFSYSTTQHFSDIPDTHWAFKYVQKMYEEGITTGYADGTYRPAENVSRSQMAAFIIRALYGESFSYSTTPYFSDVPASHGAFKYIQKVSEEGIASGYPDGTYRPSQNVNRAQMAAFIARGFLGME